jgi:hypothetical protein
MFVPSGAPIRRDMGTGRFAAVSAKGAKSQVVGSGRLLTPHRVTQRTRAHTINTYDQGAPIDQWASAWRRGAHSWSASPAASRLR